MHLEDCLSPFTTRALVPTKPPKLSLSLLSPQTNPPALHYRASLEETRLDRLISQFTDVRASERFRKRGYEVQKLKKSSFRWYTEKRTPDNLGFLSKVVSPQPSERTTVKSKPPIRHTVRLPPLPPLPKPPRPEPLQLTYEPPTTPRAWTPFPQ